MNVNEQEHVCNPKLLVPQDGDVAACRCGQWWACDVRMGQATRVCITPVDAGERARAPMPYTETLAALDTAAALMEVQT